MNILQLLFVPLQFTVLLYFAVRANLNETVSFYHGAVHRVSLQSHVALVIFWFYFFYFFLFFFSLSGVVLLHIWSLAFYTGSLASRKFKKIS